MATAYLYDAEGRGREVELTADTVAGLNEHSLLWIDVGPDDPALDEVAARLGLDPESLTTIRQSNIRPRLDNYGGYYQFTVYAEPLRERPAPPRDEHGRRLYGVGAVKVDFIVGDRWLLTVRADGVAYIESYRAQDKAETMLGAMSPQALAASLLDWHLEGYFDAVADIEATIDRLEEQIIAGPTGRITLGRLTASKRQVSRLRGLLAGQRTIFYGLARPDFTLVAESAAAAHYATLVGRYERAIDEVERTRDLVVGSFELFTSRAAQQTNDLVKALTLITVAIGLCAAIAGIFGMNFDVPIFHTGQSGFDITVAAQLAIVLLTGIYVRWQRWL